MSIKNKLFWIGFTGALGACLALPIAALAQVPEEGEIQMMPRGTKSMPGDNTTINVERSTIDIGPSTIDIGPSTDLKMQPAKRPGVDVRHLERR
jgi:hypothetical protein